MKEKNLPKAPKTTKNKGHQKNQNGHFTILIPYFSDFDVMVQIWSSDEMEDGYFYPSFCYLKLSFSSFRSFLSNF